MYEDSTAPSVGDNERSSDNSDVDSDMDDLDVSLDINKLTAEHKVILNKCGSNYGLEYGDFIRMLIVDNEEKEKVKQSKLLEAEKALHSVRLLLPHFFFRSELNKKENI